MSTTATETVTITVSAPKSRFNDVGKQYSTERTLGEEPIKKGQTQRKWTIQQLKDAIPPHCFKPDYATSLFYLFRDVASISSLMVAAYYILPMLPHVILRTAAWLGYGYIQGLLFTGIWTIGHDCGHGAFSPNEVLNNTVGFILHSFILVPYFSWRSTHRRHHRYTNNLSKDHNFVPPTKERYASLFGLSPEAVDDLIEDAPIVLLGRMLIQQVVGYPYYLLTNITAGHDSTNASDKPKSNWPLRDSHYNFLPHSTLFRPAEAPLILASDLGLAAVWFGVWYAAQHIGWSTTYLLWGMPYMWVNHWMVAIAYLQHTHISIPKFEPEAWNFIDGTIGTMDRDFWGGQHILHNMSGYHVIHHFFTRIPHYHAEEATKAIQPLLGEDYLEDRTTGFWPALYEAFTTCQYVEADDPKAAPADRKMMYKKGPFPPIQLSVGMDGIKLKSATSFME